MNTQHTTHNTQQLKQISLNSQKEKTYRLKAKKFLLICLISSSSLSAQSPDFFNKTIHQGSSVNLVSVDPFQTLPDVYTKCNAYKNINVTTTLVMPSGISHYVSTGAIRIKYELLTNTNQVVRSYEAFPYDVQPNPVLYYFVTSNEINGLLNTAAFEHKPVANTAYRIRITIRKGSSVGSWANFFNKINNWDHVVATYYTHPATVSYTDATSSFYLSSQIGVDAGNRPISCQSNVTINGAASNCETMYLLEVSETNSGWHHDRQEGADYAAQWFNGSVPSNINLQWFTATYGNPIGGDIVNGQAPSGYNGFTMRDRNYPGSPDPNFYRIKIATLQDTWVETNILIDVNGSCKTNTTTAFNPDEMIALSQSDLDSIFGKKEHSNESMQLIKDEKLKEAISIYPNPAREFAIISSTSNTLSLVSVSDVLGKSYSCEQLIAENGVLKLNTSTLKTGMYIITIFSNNEPASLKLWIK